MAKMAKSTRARYTLECKLEAVRLVKGGQALSVTAKETSGSGLISTHPRC